MQQSNLTILFGGTFDPIHQGHLRIARALHELVEPQQVQLLPNYLSADNKTHSASTQQRLDMLSLAIQDLTYLGINTIEIDRKGKSYTLDTLTTLRQDNPNTPLAFACGSDTFINIQTWDNCDQLFKLAHFIIIDRPEYNLHDSPWVSSLLEDKGTHSPSELHQNEHMKILQLDIPPMTMSATEIRNAVKNKITIDGKVHSDVKRYILKYHLYQ